MKDRPDYGLVGGWIDGSYHFRYCETAQEAKDMQEYLTNSKAEDICFVPASDLGKTVKVTEF